MNVGIVMPLAEQRGGAELLLMHLLRANQHGPTLNYHLMFLEHGSMADEAMTLGYPVSVYPAGHLRHAKSYIGTIQALRNWIRQSRLDVTMSWMAKAHLYAGVAAMLERRPTTWWQHATPTNHWIDRYATRIPARSILCCSQYVEAGPTCATPLKNTQVIYPAVDSQYYNEISQIPVAECRTQLGLPYQPTVGIFCRLQRWKGVETFFEAAKLILEQRTDAHFIIVGGEHFSEPNCASDLNKKIETAGYHSKIQLVGHKTNPAVWMQATDVVVHASFGEPFGMVVIEAMALGKKVIAADTGGPKEIITSGVDGWLFETGNAKQLSEHILYCLSHSTENLQQPQS